MHPDGQFGTRSRHRDGSIHDTGHHGNKLTIAGVGQRAVEATVDPHTVHLLFTRFARRSRAVCGRAILTA
jgi:hypothetical protein